MLAFSRRYFRSLDPYAVSLDSKHALRGGIDVGLATEIAAGEIYGTALERAYLLECQRAKYPRILIGDNLWSYLSAALLEFGKSTTLSARAARAIIQKMMGLVSPDTNGERILVRFKAIEFLRHRVEAQVCHAAQVNEDALANTYKTKEYVLANGAPSHDAGTLHIDMCLGKTLYCAAMRALSLRSRNVHREYSAQFTCGCISVKVVHGCTHFRSPSPDQVAVHRGTAALGWLQGSVVFLAGESLPSLFRTDVRATSIT